MRVRWAVLAVLYAAGVLAGAWALAEQRVARMERVVTDAVRREVGAGSVTTSTLQAVVDARVDARMQSYCDAANDGLGIETTSPAGTMWWLGYSLAEVRDDQQRVFTSLEDVFAADPELGARFKRVHKAIDDKPRSWPYQDEDLAGPYLTYSERE